MAEEHHFMSSHERKLFDEARRNWASTANDVSEIRYWLEGDEKIGFMGLIKRVEKAELNSQIIGKDFHDFKVQHFKMMDKLKNIGIGIGICLLVIAILLGYISVSDAIKLLPLVR